ncbi:hypothetical protein SAZ11_16000 [Streptomyces sp. FXJ1.4098]|nr:hypothetical protein [Streptomyces sp. FXJ1.4098]
MDDRTDDPTRATHHAHPARPHGDDVGAPYADCVLCGEPTEHPASRPGATLCPVCEWQEAQRTACSG